MTSLMPATPAKPSPVRSATFAFRARDVTGTHDIHVEDVVRGTPAGAVAQAVAASMNLPTNVPWALRNDRTGAWIPDDAALDASLEEDREATLTLTPKAHLGGPRD